jgi:enoyl-CoA hydratase/carnithine racemase
MSLQVQHQQGWVRLTLDRPEVRNALNNALCSELASAMGEAQANPGIHCIVIDGAGGQAFCSGVDLAERRTLGVEGMGRQSRLILDLVRQVALSPVPVVAAIDGWCLGAGLELALACDLRLASEGARFGFPEMALGTYPGAGGAVLLPRVVGPAKAVELLLSTRRLQASEALEAGLVTRVAPRDAFEEALAQLIDELSRLSPAAVRALKESLRRSVTLPLEEAFEMDQSLRRPLDGTANHQQALQAGIRR